MSAECTSLSYRDLVSNVREIKQIRLEHLTIPQVNRSVTGALKVHLKYDKGEYTVKDEGLEVVPHFSLEVKGSSADSDTAFSLKFAFFVSYDIESIGSFDNADIFTFVNTNVPLNIWPYARELISSMTVRMGYPPLLIEPFVYFQE